MASPHWPATFSPPTHSLSVPLTRTLLHARARTRAPHNLCPKQSGGLASAQLHVARTIARRAERQAVTLVREGQLGGDVAIFLNRLSDYLFVAARFAALKSGSQEEVYKKPKQPAAPAEQDSAQ